MIPFQYKCKTCAARAAANNGEPACAKFKILINPEQDFCAWHQNTSNAKCAFCSSTNNLLLEEINGNYYSFCEEHYKAFHTCQGCVDKDICAFKADYSEPQVVPQFVRKGNMTIQTQVRNPNLVEKHCTSCKCSYLGPDNNPICIKDDSLGCQCWRPQTAIFQ